MSSNNFEILRFAEAMTFTVPGGLPKNVQHVAIVFEESLSQMGKEVYMLECCSWSKHL